MSSGYIYNQELVFKGDKKDIQLLDKILEKDIRRAYDELLFIIKKDYKKRLGLGEDEDTENPEYTLNDFIVEEIDYYIEDFYYEDNFNFEDIINEDIESKLGKESRKAYEEFNEEYDVYVKKYSNAITIGKIASVGTGSIPIGKYYFFKYVDAFVLHLIEITEGFTAFNKFKIIVNIDYYYDGGGPNEGFQVLITNNEIEIIKKEYDMDTKEVIINANPEVKRYNISDLKK